MGAATHGWIRERMIHCSTPGNSSRRWSGVRAESVVPEEIAFRNGWITGRQLEQLAAPLYKNGYGKYLMRLLAEAG